MSHVLALYTSSPALVRCELDRVRAQLPLGGPEMSAGVGAYEDNVALQRRYGPSVPLDTVFEVPTSDAVLVHLGPLEAGQSLEESLPPFRFRQWLFVHVGDVEQRERTRERLLSELPDFLQRAVRGQTLGAAVFGAFLAELRSLGRIEDPQLEAPIAAQLLAKTAALVEQTSAAAGGTRKPSMVQVATNGRLLVAARRGEAPLAFKLLEGEATCRRCGLETPAKDSSPLVRDHRMRRTVALTTAEVRLNGWTPVPDGGAVAVDRALSLQVLPAAGR